MALKALIASVGGAPQPIIAAIEWRKPDFILFAVSEDSRAQVENAILPALACVPQNESVTISDDQDIGTRYDVFANFWRDALDVLDVQESEAPR